MEIQLLNKDKEQNNVSFLLKGSSIAFANAIRRIMIAEVPTMAIEEIEFRSNDSALYDEILAQRLGLLIIETDLKSYTLPANCTCQEEGCAKCQLKFTLKAKGDKTVYASDIKSQDPKVLPVHQKTILVKLLKGQSMEFEATGILGTGKEHMKWSPALAYFKYKPKVTVNNNSTLIDEFKDRYPPQIFDKNRKIDPNLIINLDLVDACDKVCEDIVSVEYDNSNLIFTVESWGQLSCKEIGTKAAEILENKCEEFADKIKDLN